jgi:hypothetical protein
MNRATAAESAANILVVEAAAQPWFAPNQGAMALKHLAGESYAPRYYRIAAILLTLTALALLLASPSLAAKRFDRDEPQAGSHPAKPDWDLSFTAGWAADAGVHGSGADISAAGFKARAGYKDFFLSFERVHYSWSEVERLPFGNGVDEPWDDLNVLTLGYQRNGRVSQRWMYFVGLSVSSSFEKQWNDAYSYRGFAGFTYVYSPKLQFTLGAGGVFHKVRSQGLPVVGITYNRGATKGLSAGLGFPLTFLAYHFNENWALKTRVVEFDLDIFRLADDSPASPEGFLERRDLMADLGVEWTPIKSLVLYVGARYYFKRELTLYDQDGNNERCYDVDNAWGGVLRFSWKF